MVDPLYSDGKMLNLRAAESQTITAGKILEMKSDGDVGVASAGSTTVLGVAMTDVTTTASDERYSIAVITGQEVTVTASAAVSAGALVESGSNGKSQTHTLGGTLYNKCCGRAITAASGANVEHRVLFN